jgi:hypothetical protein
MALIRASSYFCAAAATAWRHFTGSDCALAAAAPTANTIAAVAAAAMMRVTLL